MKGHSERIPNKNIRNFCGRPLLHWVMESLRKSPYIKEIVINTDSEQISEEGRKNFGARIINRPQHLRGDMVPMNDIIAYDLSQIKGEHFLQTHSTNPLLTTKTINLAIETYFSNLEQYDSLFSVTKVQARLYWPDGKPINHDPDNLLRTQDLPPVFEENSNFYIFSKKSFKRAGNNRIGLKPQMFEISKLEAVDIDEPEDWDIAEAIYEIRKDR
ncbi:MAG: acylneuraminate cytidylyltransferase [Candidatus Cloacimonas sp. 4484_209]|nr:MAG: acylneuraminate cytidylyltransferase [Candidatus Cloacimonas sp. 4484_209]RKY43110.1 MAG: acylneuraminate cytidylyltransferase family protein [Candidatus Omnitrophota bacterium]